MTLSETQKLSTGPTFPMFGMSSPRDEVHCSAMWWDSMTTHQLTAHYHRSQQQELAPVLVLVGGDGQDARAIHWSSRSATVHPSAFVKARRHGHSGLTQRTSAVYAIWWWWWLSWKSGLCPVKLRKVMEMWIAGVTNLSMICRWLITRQWRI